MSGAAFDVENLRNILLLVRQPLCRKSRPFEGRAKNHIVKEGCILLPCLVFCGDRSAIQVSSRCARREQGHNTFIDDLLFSSLLLLFLLLLNETYNDGRMLASTSLQAWKRDRTVVVRLHGCSDLTSKRTRTGAVGNWRS